MRDQVFRKGRAFCRPTKPIISGGIGRWSPEKGTETRALVLRDAAGAKTLQCANMRSRLRNLHLLRKVQKRDRGTLSGRHIAYLFVSPNSSQNKLRARPVPAAAVTLAEQVLPTNIGPKELVAGPLSFL